jgi:hypothetical protein
MGIGGVASLFVPERRQISGQGCGCKKEEVQLTIAKHAGTVVA